MPSLMFRRRSSIGWMDAGPERPVAGAKAQRGVKCSPIGECRVVMSRALFVVENVTQDLTLIRRVRRADNYLTRLRGLTFRRHLPEDEGLWLVGRAESRADAAIHMFFVFFPIGVLWLDQENRVVDKVVARPFRPFYAPRSPAKVILECRPDVLDRVQVGDQLRLVATEEVDET